MPSLKFTGKGANRAIIDPVTGNKVFVSGGPQKDHHGDNKGLLEAIL